MANGASAKAQLMYNAESVSGTGSSFEFSLNSKADEIGIITNIDSGTVAALTVNLQQKIGDTWANVAGAQTTNTSGGAIAFASAPSSGLYRINLATVTTPSSLVLSVKLIWGEK